MASHALSPRLFFALGPNASAHTLPSLVAGRDKAVLALSHVGEAVQELRQCGLAEDRFKGLSHFYQNRLEFAQASELVVAAHQRVVGLAERVAGYERDKAELREQAQQMAVVTISLADTLAAVQKGVDAANARTVTPELCSQRTANLARMNAAFEALAASNQADAAQFKRQLSQLRVKEAELKRHLR